ncbi:type II toxin-antitoxin system HipA family toxin YjjJ [Niveibacterium terrae]|uniref:type II toxin-antitoxin system HipA family toxin YjjJ n=1 Tax=Niveibacterium terrae TaxID=3373598 RepID=UPI003A91132A
MSSNAERIRDQLAEGPRTSRQLIEKLDISQPSLSRAMAELGESVLRLGAARSIQYALRDTLRGLPEMPVHRVDAEGRLGLLGTLIPVRPEGFVMRQADGRSLYSEGLPWWLADMRPAGYLGRAYVARHGAALGLPARLGDWSDTDTLRALLAHAFDLPGNLLLGEHARELFLASPAPSLISEADKLRVYPQLASEAALGERPGSSAGGEQPKFTAYAATELGARHVLVKFSEAEDSPVSERWRDLLQVEHLALETLREAGIPAARTRLIDTAGQRFLEVERFDRVGESGRHALHSLAMLDAEFVGAATGIWPEITRRLAEERIVRQEAVAGSALLWAFGSLIGNTDMHKGNLSFLSDDGRPYALAPAYDMTAMAFAPRSGGGLPETLSEPSLRSDIASDTWRQAEALALTLLARLKTTPGFSPRFAPCLAALDAHLALATERIARLG